MQTVETAIQTKDKETIFKLLKDGFLIGPQQVKTLLEATKGTKLSETDQKRKSLEKARDRLVHLRNTPTDAHSLQEALQNLEEAFEKLAHCL